jgi:flagellar assembly protein FliH
MSSLSKIFKSSRVVLDDKAFVLKTKSEQPIEANYNLAAKVGLSPGEAANQIIEDAKIEALSILENADYEAEEKLKNADKSNESIISDAYDQARGIMEQAKEDGYKDGYENGIEASQKKADEILRQATDIKKAWVKERADLLTTVEKDAVGLVLEAIEKILNHHVETDVSLIESLIKMGIQRVSKTEHMSIRVSTDDYNQALSIKPIVLAMSDKIDDIEIKRDVTLSNGSCIIDADSGSVDSGVWTQFEELKKLFEDMLKGE